MKHTPTPWKYIPSEGPNRRAKIAFPPHRDLPNAERIGCAPGNGPWDKGEDEANAAFIVRAVNLHDEMVGALEREHAANNAILVVLGEAYDRFTDNDMIPPNHKLKTWLASTRTCLKHGHSTDVEALIARAKKGET